MYEHRKIPLLENLSLSFGNLGKNVTIFARGGHFGEFLYFLKKFTRSVFFDESRDSHPLA